MPYVDPANKKLHDIASYQEKKSTILKRKRENYKTRDALIMENIKLTAQVDDLNAKLLTAIEGKRYIKPKSDIVDVEIVTGNYTVCFQ